MFRSTEVLVPLSNALHVHYDRRHLICIILYDRLIQVGEHPSFLREILGKLTVGRELEAQTAKKKLEQNTHT